MKPVYKTITIVLISAAIILNISYSSGEKVDGIFIGSNYFSGGTPIIIESCEDTEYDIQIQPKFTSVQLPDEPKKASLQDVIRQLQILTGQIQEQTND